MDEQEATGPSAWERMESLPKAPLVAQMSGSEEFLMEAPPHHVKQEPTEGLQDLWENQWQEFLRTLQAPDLEWGTSQMSDRLTPWDDARTFLASFEQVATVCRWPRDKWVTFLWPALSGEAEQAFSLLRVQGRADYEKVKAAILEEEATARERQRQYFRQLRYQDTEGPRGIYEQLRELGCRWLKVERRTKDEILELLILEQFLSILPVDMQIWVRKCKPGSCTQAVTLAEDFLLKRKEAAKLEPKVPPTEEAVEPSETGQTLDGWAAQLSRDTKEGERKEATWLCDEQVWGKEMNSIHPKGQEQTDPKDVSLETNKDFQYCKNGAVLESPSERGNVPAMGPEKGVDLTIFCTDDLGRAPEQQKFLGDQVQHTKSDHRGNFGQSSDLLPHQSTDTAGKSYLSLQGGNNLVSNQALITQSGVYTSPGSMKCSPSDQRFNSASSFKEHLSTPNGESSFICCYCGRNFGSSSVLREHLRAHTGERPYRCLDCGKGFNQKHYLTIHERLHSGEKPYQCIHCGKSFPERSRLLIHERIHTGENPFVCSECGKGFNQKGNLMTHMRLHTGEKPYKCALCERRFSQKAGLSSHEKTHIGLKRTF
ncbi:zinc finger and SCAN domain-containing protein 21-like [Pantherophis guttatus]|uniref:Zinc finger and SCAN domain-containing protein 21-like n=1 Tax=Pantherophis guttatus TaxID=94885 RepID=A0A6P9B9I3_PANGU|nr:zinc finger and SCAN domain-containing protein 21-like [Pantherophis guttatus]